MINMEANEVIEEFFQSPFSRYQIGLDLLMKGSEKIYIYNKYIYLFVFIYCVITFMKRFRRGEPYIDCPV